MGLRTFSAARVAVVCVLGLVACGGWIDRTAATTTYRVLAAAQDVADREADVELARAALPGGIVQLAAFARAYPDDRRFRVLAADARCQYAFAFLADDWEAAQLATAGDHEAGDREAIGREAIGRRLDGQLALCIEDQLALLPPAWRAAHGDPALLAGLRRADVAAVRAIASADALRLALAPIRHLRELPSITAALRACVRVDPGGDDARAELVLASIAGARSALLGGDDGSADLAQARAHAGDRVLMIDVVAARSVAVARRDRALFEATLARVLAADVTRWPDHRLANELALRKARRYLAAEASLLP